MYGVHAMSRPLVIPDVAVLRRLAGVRTLIEKHLPKETRAQSTWRHVVAEVDKAVAGGDTRDVSAALQMVLQLERVTYQMK